MTLLRGGGVREKLITSRSRSNDVRSIGIGQDRRDDPKDTWDRDVILARVPKAKESRSACMSGATRQRTGSRRL